VGLSVRGWCGLETAPMEFGIYNWIFSTEPATDLKEKSLFFSTGSHLGSESRISFLRRQSRTF
jgi:hypothetical protein